MTIHQVSDECNDLYAELVGDLCNHYRNVFPVVIQLGSDPCELSCESGTDRITFLSGVAPSEEEFVAAIAGHLGQKRSGAARRV